jgi:hypothetical protein
MTREKRHQFTKEEIRKVLTLWETKSLADIAIALNLTEFQVQYIAGQIRKVDPTILPRKKKANVLQGLIREILTEQN